MRTFLITAVVLGSLIFSVGGVAVVGRAASSEQSHMISSELKSGGQCAEPVHGDPFISAAQLSDDGHTIPLNTRGYNYAAPGEIQMDPAARPSSSQPPASPEEP